MSERDDLLRVLDVADTALALADRRCGDEPAPGKRCQECVGCLMEVAFQMAEAALAKARGTS